MIRFVPPLCFLFLFTSTTLFADAENLRFFENKVRPLLAEECYQCHGPDKAKSGLRVDHLDFLLRGGDTGPAIDPGEPDKSLLVEVVRRSDPDFAMPPKKELTKTQIEVLETWVEMGAPWPEEVAQQSGTDEHGFSKEDYEWWAIQPLQNPDVPLSNSGWAQNEIDHFILRKLDESGLEPASPAGPHEIVRRMYLDLHGLVPTLEQAENFRIAYAADSADAIETLIDELLASPRYGERWGQHWLDVVRYAESDGYRADGFRPDSWRYRDYVIRSFNEDKPYDQFVREQLAADEFAADDPDTLIATAFLRLGIYEWNQRNAEMQWDLIMTEMTNVTGEAFLGLGIGCAQCHDHKFDPILQKDYFAMQSFLNTSWWPEEATLASPENRKTYESQLQAWQEATQSIQIELEAMKEAKLKSAREGMVKQFPDEVQTMYWKSAGERTAYEEQIAQLVQRQVDHTHRKIDWKKEFSKKEELAAKYAELSKQLEQHKELKPEPLPSAFITTDVGSRPAKTTLKSRGEEKVIEPAFLTLLGKPAPEIVPTKNTTGRRLALANWIASPDNSLSTRVITNRIWQRHFGSGLVPTPNDFGTLGEAPSHPELLDWLTKRMLQNDWRLKDLHRLIMSSATYQQTARREPTTTEELADADNRLLWRFPPQRLDAEQIRDSMLLVSGELRHREGGQSVDGNTPERSIYVKKRRNTKDPVIGAFDAPRGFSSAPSRLATTTPNQSLLLVNSEWAIARAAAFAKNLLSEEKRFGKEEATRAYQSVFVRDPEPEEIDLALAFVEAQKTHTGVPAPVYKYPGETGLRPTEQKFSGVPASFQLGEHSLWLQPGSRFEKLSGPSKQLPEDHFTIEAVASIDSIYKDASVNTLASQWNGSQKSTGWSLGVTSEKSRYEPMNLIVQIVGDDFQGNRIYEVVASNLRVPKDKPFYASASISAVPCKEDPTKGSVTFYLQDLSNPKSEVQTAKVPHQIVGGLAIESGVPFLVGGRNQERHLWDGQVGRLAVRTGSSEERAPHFENAGRASLLDWNFSNGKEGVPVPETAWIQPKLNLPSHPFPPQLLGAVTDFCHALLNSNEFLYQH